VVTSIATTAFGAHAPVEEPSTASGPDINSALILEQFR
jgi:hypothetical protein